jgi:hypothetical protein
MISLNKKLEAYIWLVAFALIKSVRFVEETLNMMNAGWGYSD